MGWGLARPDSQRKIPGSCQRSEQGHEEQDDPREPEWVMGGHSIEHSAKDDNSPRIEHGEQDADCHTRRVVWDQSRLG